MIEPLVSIGMPVFNDEKFITLALESLLNQDYTNFELIISDDCSSDTSRAICMQFEKIDKRIRYIRQAKNIGISKNMIFLLNEAKGDYFMWAANDDIWDSRFISTLLPPLVEKKAIASFCPMVFIDEDSKVLEFPVGRATDYSGNTAMERLLKLIHAFDDCMGYGLFIREEILKVEFPIWWGINKTCAYNNIYPTLCHYLAKGDFALVGENPLWFNRLKDEKNIHHKVPFNNHYIRGLFAFSLRKFNMIVISLKLIFTADRNIINVLRISPSMLWHWFCKPVYYAIFSKTKLLVARKVKFY